MLWLSVFSLCALYSCLFRPRGRAEILARGTGMKTPGTYETKHSVICPSPNSWATMPNVPASAD